MDRISQFVRPARRGLFALTLFVAAAGSLPAQALEFRPVVGNFNPTGSLKELVDNGPVAGAQVSYTFARHLAVTGTLFMGTNDYADRFVKSRPVVMTQYDAGIEGRLPSVTKFGAWDAGFFAGAGIGSRMFSLRKSDHGSTTGFGGYGAVGGTLARESGLGLRLEARGYNNSIGGINRLLPREGRSDFVVLAGLTFRP
jgi:hypothetical protein